MCWGRRLRQFVRCLHLRNLRHIGEGDPILRRKRDAPDVAGNFQLQRHLKKLPHCSRPLNPGNAAAHRARWLADFRVGDLHAHPHVFQDVVFRLVAATMAIDNQRRGPLHEGAPEGVDTRHDKRDRLHDTGAAALPQFRALVRGPFGHHFNCLIGKIAA